MPKQLICLSTSSTSLRQFPLFRQFFAIVFYGDLRLFRLARWLRDRDRVHPTIFLVLKANLAAHSLSKVFFTFFGLPLADENGQDRFFFLEDIHTLIMAREIARQTSACDTLPR